MQEQYKRQQLSNITNNSDSLIHNLLMKLSNSKRNPNILLKNSNSKRVPRQILSLSIQGKKKTSKLSNVEEVKSEEKNNNEFFITKVDIHNQVNPQTVFEYVSYIYSEYLLFTKNSFYISTIKGSSNTYVRANSINAFIHIQHTFKLLDETLYLAISIYDKYSNKPPPPFIINSYDYKENTLLTISACIFVASKYEEIYYPESRDFIWISNNAFDKKQLLQKEYSILSSLNFSLTIVSPLKIIERLVYIKQFDFESVELIDSKLKNEYDLFLFRNKLVKLPFEHIRRFNKSLIFHSHFEKENSNLIDLKQELYAYSNSICLFFSQLFLDICILDNQIDSCSTADLACACFYLSRKLIINILTNKNFRKQYSIWDNDLINHTKLNATDLSKLAKQICLRVDSYKTSSLKSINNKYCSVRYLEVYKINLNKNKDKDENIYISI